MKPLENIPEPELDGGLAIAGVFGPMPGRGKVHRTPKRLRI